MKVYGFILPFLLAFSGGCSSARSTEGIPAVRCFDLPHYLRNWYEIARLPNHFEHGMDYVTAEYSLNTDGTVRVVNRGIRNGEKREISGIAKFKSSPGIGELRVSFFRPFYSDYRIIRLAPDYSYAVVTGSTDNFLWILSRTPRLPENEREKLLADIRRLGFDTGRLVFPEQGAGK